MLHTIQNAAMRVTIDSLGAQMMSITAANGTEYLWGGDAAYWRNRAPNLFPYVGRLTEDAYTLRGQRYEMTCHGFASRSQFTAVVEEESRIILGLTDSEETRRIYPFAFEFSVTYELEGNTLHIIYAVENRTKGTMYFGLGGHPGFRVPLEAGKEFEDYRLEFAHPCRPSRVLLSENYMTSGQEVLYPLENGTVMPLRHDLFDDDAVILDHTDKTVTLSAPGGRRGVTLSIPQMRYLGIWHKPHSDAPYVCLEPWVSLPSRQDVVEDLSQQGDLIALEAGDTYVNQWSITVF